MSETYDKRLDGERLGKQHNGVLIVMLAANECDEWYTLGQIRRITGYPEASISARLRDLRRLGYLVVKRRRGKPKLGCWEYSVRRSSSALSFNSSQANPSQNQVKVKREANSTSKPKQKDSTAFAKLPLFWDEQNA